MGDESRRRVEVLQAIMESRELNGSTESVEEWAVDSLTTEYTVTLSFVEWVSMIFYYQGVSQFIPDGLITNPIVITAYDEMTRQIEEIIVQEDKND